MHIVAYFPLIQEFGARAYIEEKSLFSKISLLEREVKIFLND